MALEIGRRRLNSAVAEARQAGRPVPTTVIVGGGLSGIGAAIQLVRSGLRSFTVIEQSDGVGGTWRDNSYPGSGCDVPSHLYSFSFATKSDWSRRFAEQPEILGYAEDLVHRFDLGPHLRLRTSVTSVRYDDPTGVWLVTVENPDGSQETLTADNVVLACGQLNRPYTPDIEGREDFSGPMWHSARWNHDVDLTGRQVAVIGSGASAIQFVPPVARAAGGVVIYQHSPSYVAPKKDRVYGHLARILLERVTPLERLYRWWIYLSLEARWQWFKRDSWTGNKLRQLFTKEIRVGVVDRGVPAESVIPDYPLGCKRILISGEWYPTLLRPDVEVVNDPIERFEADAVVTRSGDRRPADVIIFGTGFSTTDFLGAIPVTGRAGVRLSEVWKDGAHAYLGTCVAGFPNLFVLYGPNTNLGHNSILFMVERQLNLMLQLMAEQTRQMTPGRVPAVEVTAAAWERDDRRTQRWMADTTWVANCHSWYKDARGRVTNNWPSWTARYWWETLRMRRRDIITVAGAPPHLP